MDVKIFEDFIESYYSCNIMKAVFFSLLEELNIDKNLFTVKLGGDWNRRRLESHISYVVKNDFSPLKLEYINCKTWVLPEKKNTNYVIANWKQSLESYAINFNSYVSFVVNISQIIKSEDSLLYQSGGMSKKLFISEAYGDIVMKSASSRNGESVNPNDTRFNLRDKFTQNDVEKIVNKILSLS